MNPSKLILDEKLAELESVSGVSEHEIESQISRLRNANSQEDPCQEWRYEVMALSFHEGHSDKKDGRGTYFGPMMVWRTDQGETIESPSLKLVNQETISYWQQRAFSTKNPLLQARYAGLVWDLSGPATGTNPDHIVARVYCDAILRLADERRHEYDADVIRKLKHTLSIAISLNDQALIERTKLSIMRYEKEIAEDSKPGLWGFSFDLLVGNNGVGLTEREEAEIISDLEGRLQRLKGGDPWKCENAAGRLANYYRRKGCDTDCARVIKELGSSFEKAAANAAPLGASSWLEHMHQVYLQFNLREDAERLACNIRELGPKVRDNMKPISHEMKIPREEFDAYVEKMVEGNLDDTLARIAIKYIPRRGEIEKQLQDLSKKAPLSFLFTKQLMDHQGRVVAAVGSLENDLDSNVVSQMSQNMAISSTFLAAILDRVVSKFSLTEDLLLKYIFSSPIFHTEQEKLLLAAMRSYLQEDYLTSIHLFIPQIEAAIRNLVELSGGAVLKQARGGGFHLKILDELLRTEQTTRALSEDVALYFRVTLTDQRGWNIRNNVCHGLLPYDNFSRVVADRLLHILLVIAQLRAREDRAKV